MDSGVWRRSGPADLRGAEKRPRAAGRVIGQSDADDRGLFRREISETPGRSRGWGVFTTGRKCDLASALQMAAQRIRLRIPPRRKTFGLNNSRRRAGNTTVVLRDNAFADNVAKINPTAILWRHGSNTGRSLSNSHRTNRMYLMYVDESGDCGLPADGSPTDFFCLSGLVVHELRWRETMSQLLQFRHWLKKRYRVYLEDELHTANMINKPSTVAASLQKLSKHQRLAIIRNFANEIASLSDVSIINVVIDKRTGKVPNKDEVFRWAWFTLFQRFENTIRYQNFPGPKNADERGIIFPDATDGQKVKQFLDSMRLNNQLKVRQPSGAFVVKNEPIKVIIEDPVVRDSQHSYLIQAADCAVFLLKQSVQPSSYMKKHGGNAYFKRLDPVLCKHASNKDPAGVVRL